MKISFLLLFQVYVEILKCEVYKIFGHTYRYFHLKGKESKILFFHIHSAIWGLCSNADLLENK